jgi:hypothetical protein
MLKIICPTSILEFKPIITRWIELHITITYELIFEKGEPPSGQAIRQKYTDLWANDNCYIYYHDHDSLISPEVCNYLNNNLDFINPKIYMFGQIWFANGIKRLNANSENCKPIKCDISQLVVYSSFVKGLNWTNDYHNDGIFITNLHDLYPDKFVFENEINAYYNALIPNKGLYNGQIITIA